jgi:hypothetical protein
MRHLLVSAAAVMAITGAAAVGNAQMQDKPSQDRSPSAERAAPPSGGIAEKEQPTPSNREQKSEPRKGAESKPGREKQPRAAQQNESQKDKSATQPQRDKDERKSTDQQRQRDQDKQKSTEQQRQRDQDKQKSADQDRQRDQDKRKSTDQQRQRDQDKQKSTEQQRQRAQDKQKSTDQQRQRDQDKQKSTKGPDDKQGGRVQVSEEKRSGVRDRLRNEGGRVDRVNRTSINVSINVGARIPRSVRLHTLPVSIVSFAPEYRGYSYILLEDETICIVDSNTYVIVDVIPAGSQRADRPGRTHLTLSQEDMRFIYRTVPKGRMANVRVRLALGAEVPRDVELVEFPAEVVERVPDVRRYRYIVTENDVVLVDPDDHQVALVINE